MTKPIIEQARDENRAVDFGPHVEVTATRQPVVIWSGEHRAWWGPNRCGYFTDPARIGLYTPSEAAHATHHVGPEKMIRIEDVPKSRADRDRDLDKIEALTGWCRDHVTPPPADLLYAAAGAVENLRNAGGPPPITSLIDWTVGGDDLGRPTVTLNLDKAEARLWAGWLLGITKKDAAP